MNPIAIALQAELDQAEARQAELGEQLETQDQLVAHLQRVLDEFNAGPAAELEVDESPAPETAPEVPPTKLVDQVDPPTDPEPESPVETPRTEKRKSADVIRPHALRLRDACGTFTSKELGEALEVAGQPFSPPPISKCLSKMADDGELVQVARGGPGKSAVWGDPETSQAAPAPSPRKKLETGGRVDMTIKLDGERVGEQIAARARDEDLKPPRPPIEPGGDTHTARNGEDIDDVVFQEIEEEAPVAYHEIVQATGESGVLIKAALGRLKAQGRIEEGHDGKFRVLLSGMPSKDEKSDVDQDLRKRIRAVLKAHNGASARKLSGLLRGVTDPEIADELHRMQDEDLVNYYGLTRQWKLIED